MKCVFNSTHLSQRSLFSLSGASLFITTKFLLFVTILVLFSFGLSGQTFTVDTLGDDPDINVGDGVCADANGDCTLRAAIEEANAASGSIIQFSVAGTIDVSTILPPITDELNIEGDSAPGDIVIQNNGSTFTPGLFVIGDDVIVKGLSITEFFDGIRLMGNNVTIGGSNADESVYLYGNLGPGISAGGVLNDNLMIENVYSGLTSSGAVNGNQTGIQIFNGNNIVIKDSQISNNTALGISIFTSPGTSILNCNVNNNENTNIRISNSDNSIVTDCIANNSNSTYGIHFNFSDFCEVNGCTTNDNQLNGIYLRGSNGIIENSTANNNGRSSIHVQGSDCRVENNTTSNAELFSELRLTESTNSEVINNTFNSTQTDGIIISVSPGIEISNNTITRANGPAGYGIDLETSDNSIITDNTCSDFSFGINVRGDNHQISGNTLTNNNFGIQCQNTTNVIVQNNTSTGTANDHFSFNGSVDVDLINNTVSGGGDGAQFDISSHNAFIDGNVFVGDGGGFSLGITTRGDDAVISNNTISNYYKGVEISSSLSTQNKITENSIFCNSNKGISVFGNNNIDEPIITSTSTSSISGTAGAGDLIELFSHDDAGCGGVPCQGKTFSGNTWADGSGNWMFTGSFPAEEIFVTTATDGANNTSEFSDCGFICPAASVDAVTSITGCVGDAIPQITFGGSGDNYVWTADNMDTGIGALSGVGNISTFTATAGTTTITVQAYTKGLNDSDDNGTGDDCVDESTSFTITVNENPIVSTTATDTELCGGEDLQLDGESSGGGGSPMWDWTGPNTFESSIEDPLLTSVTSAADGDYTLVVTDINGCMASSTVAVTILPSPAVNADATLLNVCDGDDINLTEDGGDALDWDWTGPNSFMSGDQNPTITGVDEDAEGTYTVVVEDSNTCTASSTIDIFVLENPVPIFTLTDTYCFGATTDILPTQSDNGINGTWSPSSIDNTVNGVYTFTKDAGICADPFTLSVTIHPLPMPVCNVDANESCVGANDGEISVSGGPFTSILWDDPAMSTTPSVTGLAPAIYTVIVTDANGCQNTCTAEVMAGDPIVTPTFSVTDEYCIGDITETLPSASDNGIAGTWSPSTIDNTTGQDYVFTPDIGLCADPFTLSVTINALPTPTCTVDNSESCVGSNDGEISVSGGPFTMILWDDPAMTTTPTVTGLAPAIYTVIVTDANGCEQTCTAEVMVGAPIVTPTFTLTTIYCSGDVTDVLPASSDNGISGTWSPSTIDNTTGQDYIFTPDAGLCADPFTLSVTINALPTPTCTVDANESCVGSNDGEVSVSGGPFTTILWDDPAMSTTPSVTGLAPAIYTVIVTNANGCEQTCTAEVMVGAPIVTPTFSLTNTYCSGDITDVLPPSSDNGIAGTWSPSTIDNLTGADYTFSPDAGLCADPFTLSVTINALPTPTCAVDNNESCLGSNDGQVTVSGGPFASILWDDTAMSTTPTVSNLAPAIYTVIVTDANGCEQSCTAEVLAGAPIVTPTFTLTNTYCSGDTPNFLPALSDNGISGTWSPSSIDNMTSADYIFTPDAGLCANPFTLSVTINALPTPVCMTVSDESCAGASDGEVNVSGGPFTSVLWNDAGASTSESVSGLPPGNYTATVIDANGCESSCMTEVLAGAPIITPIFNITNFYCSGETTDALPTTSDNGITGTWSPSIIDNLIDDDYVFTPTAGLCADPFTLTVTIGALPQPTCVTLADETCIGADDGEVNVSGGPFTSVLWDDPLLSTTETVTNLAPGTYTVIVTNTDGCESTCSAIVAAGLPVLTPTFTLTSEYCENAVVDILPLISDNGVGGTWSPTTIDNTTSGNYVFTPNPTECAISTTLNVIIIDLPMPICTTVLDESCEGSDDGEVNVSGGPFSSILWDDPASSNTASVTGLAPGLYTVIVTNADGCEQTCSTTVLAGPGMTTPTFTLTDEYCNGEIVDLLPGTSDNGISGSWSPAFIDDAVSDTYTFTPNSDECALSFTLPVTVNDLPEPEISGPLSICEGQETIELEVDPIYNFYDWGSGPTTSATLTVSTGDTYTVSVTDSNGCVGSTSVIVNGNTPPIANIIGSLSYCPGSSTTLSAGTFDSYQWQPTGETTEEIMVSTSGDYFVTVTDVNGCTAESSVTVIEDAELIITIGGNLVVCPGETIELDAGSGFSAYSWTSGGSSSIEEVSIAGDYTVTVTDVTGCTGSSTVTVSEASPVVPELDYITECEDEKITVFVSNGTFDSYNWTGGLTGSTLIVSVAGNYELTVTDSDGCETSADIDVTFYPLPTPNIIGELAFCPDGSTTLSLDQSYDSYDWSNGEITPSISVDESGGYIVIVTDSNGCEGTASVAITEGPVTVVNCDDNNPCTLNDEQTILDADGSICVPCTGTLSTCATGPVTVQSCDDGDPNTVNDEEVILNCDGSICTPCMGVPTSCDGSPTSIVSCDDGNPCTVNDEETILDSDGTVCVPCSGDLQDCGTGPLVTQSCDDGNPNTVDDEETLLQCDGSICIPCAGTATSCDDGETLVVSCDDSNPCTVNDVQTVLESDGTICVPCTGQLEDCSNGQVTIQSCDDGDSNTINDEETVLACDGTVCVPCMGVPTSCDGSPTTVVSCDDGNPCTVNDEETILDSDGTVCVPCSGQIQSCSTGPASVQTCDDGNPNTVNDEETILDCDGTVCVPCLGEPTSCDESDTTVISCDDGNPCTVNDEETILDSDGTICVPCSGQIQDCGTGPSTVQSCDDGDPNTVNDEETILDCDGSVCIPCTGTPTSCDDNPTSSVACDDGNPCTINDVEVILDSDGTICEPCLGESLDCDTGLTVIQSCDDGNPDTINDEETILDCDGSICIPCLGEAVDCDTGATSEVACDDGIACTINDIEVILDSDGSVCEPCSGTEVDCLTGETIQQSCDDGDPDTINDSETVLSCDGSVCIPCQGVSADCLTGTTLTQDCDDGNPCTQGDSEVVLASNGNICEPCSGTLIDCSNGEVQVVSCDDGNPQTIDDVQSLLVCDGSICIPCQGVEVDCDTGSVTEVSCDDGDECTIDDVQSVLDADGTICIPCIGVLVDCSNGETVTQACDDNNPDTFDDEETVLVCGGEICVPCQGTECEELTFITPPDLCTSQESYDLQLLHNSDEYEGTWEYQNGPTASVVIDNGILVLNNDLISGDYTLSFTPDQAELLECNGSLEIIIPITVQLTAGDYLGDRVFCFEEETELSLWDFLSDADTNGTWSEVAGNPTFAFDPSSPILDISQLMAGEYVFIYEISELLPCPSSDVEVRFTIEESLLVDVGIGGSLDCDQTSLIIGGANTSSGNGETYEWIDDSGTLISDERTTSIDTPGTYTLIVTDTEGCTDQETLIILLGPNTMTETDTTVVSCLDNPVVICDQTFFGTDEPTLITCVNAAGTCTTLYTVEVQSISGVLPTLDDHLYVFEDDEEQVNLLDFSNVEDLDDFELTIDNLPSSLEITNNSDGQSISLTSDFVDEAQFEATLCETVCGDCVTATFTITYTPPECTTEAVMTPNGDGMNDQFVIDCNPENLAMNFPENQLIIFNRWGQAIYETVGYDNNWSGEFEGKQLPEGTYYYQFNYGLGVQADRFQGQAILGTITLLR